MALPVFRPTVKRKDMGSVLSCIVSDRLGPGEISRDLVSRVCHVLGHAGGISLATSYLAVSAALEALGLSPSDAVVVPALAPSTWLRVLMDRGLVPMVCDVDPETGSLDTAQAAALVQKGARAVMVPHTLGIIADISALSPLGVPIIEDASQALGGKIGETPCGGMADLCLLSMEPEHIVTCGGGALVLGRSRQAAAALKRVQESSPRYSPLADMNAALGISQLAALESFVMVRREVAAAYAQALLKSRHKALVQKTEADHVFCSFPVALSDGMKDVRGYALKKSVDTVPAFAESIAALGTSNPDQPSGPAATAVPEGAAEAASQDPAAGCPNARSLALRCLLFPLYPMLGKRDVEAVCRVLSTMP
ncbi:MAG TPA: DegT/DnrJ/EryC1/StrS family aminotransferase [Spirochaetia bacterium]|nr:DegT/DnrJ/EryC1/StrS family aminotransferase [Spirochaetia bacterium]